MRGAQAHPRVHLDTLIDNQAFTEPWMFFQEHRICPVPFVRFNVDSGGSVHCCCDIERESPPELGLESLQSFGNICDESYLSLWNGDKIMEWRWRVLNNKYEGMCSDACSKKHRILSGSPLFPHKDLVTWRHVESIVEHGVYMAELPGFVQAKGSRACNLHCRMCRANATTRITDEESKTNGILFAEVLPEYIHSIRVLEIAPAGEVFFHDQANRFLEFLRDYDTENLSLRVVTNGILLTPRRVTWLEESDIRFLHLNVSVDAATEETYKKIRLGGKWDVLMRNLAYIKERRQKRCWNNRIHTTLSFVAQAPNVHEIADFARMARAMGADAVNFQRFGGVHMPSWNFFVSRDPVMMSELRRQLRDPVMSEPWVLADQLRRSLD